MFHVKVNWFTVLVNVPDPLCGLPFRNSVVRPTVLQLLGSGPMATSVFAAGLVTGLAGMAFAQPVPEAIQKSSVSVHVMGTVLLPVALAGDEKFVTV